MKRLREMFELSGAYEITFEPPDEEDGRCTVTFEIETNPAQRNCGKRTIVLFAETDAEALEAAKIVGDQKRALKVVKKEAPAKREERTVTVCSACNRAACWQGKSYCEDFKASDTREATVSELRKRNLESERYWSCKANAGLE